MAISKTLRYEVLRRDNHACRYCGATAPDVQLHIDHVVPIALAGSDDPTNLVAACADCNAGKSATSADAPVVEDIAQDALRWRRAVEAANEIAQRERDASRSYRDFFAESWNAHGWKDSRGEFCVEPVPGDWPERITDLYNAGFPMTDLQDCIRIAHARLGVKETYPYFLGVVRQRLAQRQSLATELIRRGLV